MRRSVLCLLLASTGAPGCQTQAVSLAAGPREYVASDYPQILKKWTRSGSLITLSELDDMLTVSATFESWDFRWAYVIRYAADFRLTIEQRRAKLDEFLLATGKTHEFYVALYGTDRRATDLAKPTSAWVVRLVDDTGAEIAPSEVVPITKPGAMEKRYYPYTSPWRQAFRLRFPARKPDGSPSVSPRATWFGLRFAGALGSQELRWDLVPASASRK